MNSKRIVHIAYFTMLTIIGGLIKIPFGAVSFSFQTLFVILSGLLLGSIDGMFSQIVYIVLGLIGLPIFTNGGGFSYVLYPTFGYLVAFPISSFLCGLLVGRSKTIIGLKLYGIMILSLLPCYIIGAIYQVLVLSVYYGYEFVTSLITLVNLPVLFIIDAIILYLVSLIYPRLTNLKKA